MRIGLLCNEYPPRKHGGIGTFCADFARGLQASGHEPHIIEVQDSAFEHKSAVPVHTLHRYAGRRGNALISRLLFARSLARLQKKLRLDVLEVPDFGGWLPFSRPTGLRTVVRLHTSTTLIAPYGEHPVRRSIRSFERNTLRRADLWIAPSQHVLSETSKAFRLPGTNNRVIYNPIPLDPNTNNHAPTSSPLSNTRYLLFAGWVGRAKGAFALAEALPAVFATNPELHCVFLGSPTTAAGRPATELIREIVGPEHGARIHFPGHVSRSEVEVWMKHAELFVLPSYFESFGLVYFEALAAGLPVIASSRSVEPELFSEVPGVELVDPDAPTQISEAISRILSDRDSYVRSVHASSKNFQQKFSLDRCIEESLSAYRDLLK